MVFSRVFGNSAVAALMSAGALAWVWQHHGAMATIGVYILLHSTGGLPTKYFPAPFQVLYKIYCSELIGFRIKGALHPRIPEPHSRVERGIRVLGCEKGSKWEEAREGLLVYPVAILNDNYCYLLVCLRSGVCAAVDPADPARVCEELDALRRKLSMDLELTHILTTHKHWDHAGGNFELMQKFPGILIVGSTIDKPHCANYFVENGSHFVIGNCMDVRVMHSPGHTAGSVMFLIADGSARVDDPQVALFTGDCIFCGGCGAMFETHSVKDVVDTYSVFHNKARFTDPFGVEPTDENVLVFVGHEYTERLLHETFERLKSEAPPKLNTFEANSIHRYKEVVRGRKTVECTIPSSLLLEKATNPLLSLDEEVLKQFQHREKQGVAVASSDIEHAVYCSSERRKDTPSLA